MASLPPDSGSFADSGVAAGPPSLSHLPVLTEEIEWDAAQELTQQSVAADQSHDREQELEQPSLHSQPVVDPAYMQQFLAQTIDEALVLAIQQSMPRFIAQVRTQVAATVQRRLRDEIERLQRS
jgi:hypothetical protein